jgi:hypothetical protein
MKESEFNYFIIAFIVGMFIHYNIKQICKVGLLEGAGADCPWYKPGIIFSSCKTTPTTAPKVAEKCGYLNYLFFFLGWDPCKKGATPWS